jgi:hypothetical protein
VGEVNGETEVRVGVGAGVEDTSTKHHLRVEYFSHTNTKMVSIHKNPALQQRHKRRGRAPAISICLIKHMLPSFGANPSLLVICTK